MTALEYLQKAYKKYLDSDVAYAMVNYGYYLAARKFATALGVTHKEVEQMETQTLIDWESKIK